MARLGFGTLASTYLGIDIGMTRIKAVELGRQNGGLAVRAAGLCPTPPGTVRDGRIADPAAVGRAIAGMLGGMRVRTRRAVVSVNGQVAIVREIRMPKVSPEEVKAAARFELERFLPYPVAEVTYDTFTIGEVTEGGGPRLEVLVAAARTDVLTQHVAAVEAARLEPIVLDVEPFALLRAMGTPGAGGAQETAIYVDIGAVSTEIVIADGTIPRLIRNVAFGGNVLTRLISEHLRVDFDAAEAIKQQLGDERQATEGGVELQPLREVVIGSIGDLATEIRRSLDYYQTRYRVSGPSRVLVTGGTALLPGLPQYLGADLGIQVEVGDPFRGVAAAAGVPGTDLVRTAAPSLAVAVGLARRGVDES